MSILLAEPSSLTKSYKFIRRADIDADLRLKMAVYYASDEIYMIGHQPVLVTVDSVSSTILRMESFETLTKEAWENHWQTLQEVGIKCLGLRSSIILQSLYRLSNGL